MRLGVINLSRWTRSHWHCAQSLGGALKMPVGRAEADDARPILVSVADCTGCQRQDSNPGRHCFYHDPRRPGGLGDRDSSACRHRRSAGTGRRRGLRWTAGLSAAPKLHSLSGHCRPPRTSTDSPSQSPPPLGPLQGPPHLRRERGRARRPSLQQPSNPCAQPGRVGPLRAAIGSRFA